MCMCVCVYMHVQIRTYMYIYSYMSNFYTHALPSIPPSSFLHPNLEFFIPQLPRRVLFYILCKFLPVCPSALRSFRPLIPAGRGL